MADTDKSEWILLDTDLTTRISILPVTSSHLYLEFCEPGSGELRIPLDSTAAGLIESGMFCQCYYRGSARGGFFVENIKEVQANASEYGGRELSVSGRGALALLDDAIIWDDGSGVTTREFTTKTKAYILKTFIDEAIARGGLPSLTYDFDATTDSAGDPWTDSEDYKMPVGTSLLDVVRQFAKNGIEFEINQSGGGFVLSAYANGIGTNKASTQYMRIGTNCEEISSDERGDEIINAYRVKYKNGYATVSDATSITARRRREKLLSLEQAQSAPSAITYASAKVANTKDPKKSISLRVYDGVAPYLFLDYELGDTISADNLGTIVSYRVLGVQCDFDGVNFSNIVLELNNLLYDNELRMNADLDWLLNQWNTAKDANETEVSFWAAVGISDGINDILIYNDNLYAAGAGDIGNSLCQRVGRYDFAAGTWVPMPLNSALISAVGYMPSYYEATALVEWSGDIYVAVSLNDAGGGAGTASLTYIFKWDGSAWQYFNSFGVFSAYTQVKTNQMVIEGSYMYMCFDYVYGNDGSDFRYIYYSDVTGATQDVYAKIHTGGNSITSMCFFGGTLYATCKDTARPLLKYSGGNLATVSLASIAGEIGYKLAIYNNELLIVTENKVCTWDGVAADCTVLFTTTEYFRTALVNLSDIYVGGSFSNTNLLSGVFGTVRYNAGGISGLGNPSGVAGGLVSAFQFNGDDLFAAGNTFGIAGGVTAYNLSAYFTNFENALKFISNNENSFDMAAAIHNASASAVTDSDEFGFWEDVSNALAKITWANIKATLKTYFDTLYVALTGSQTIAGTKTFSSDVIVPDEAYDATAWNGSLEVPTKNAIRDKIEAMGSGGVTSVNGDTGTVVITELQAELAITASITPAAITADVTDYNPTGGSTATIWRLSADNHWDINGIAGGTDGRIIVIENVGGVRFQLAVGAGSTSNQFTGAYDYWVEANAVVVIVYDGTISKWRIQQGLGLDYATSNFAPTSKGVTNGDSHDHNGGDGGTISFLNLSNSFNDGEGNPAAIGTAADGISTYAARRDHVHAITNGESVLGSAFTITGTAGTFQDTGLTVTLPSAGTYRITANVRGALTANGGAGTSAWWLVAELYNATDAAAVANSERIVVLTATNAVLFQMTCPVDSIVTVAASKTINLYACRNGNGTPAWTTSTIESNTAGRTVLSYEKIG